MSTSIITVNGRNNFSNHAKLNIAGMLIAEFKSLKCVERVFIAILELCTCLKTYSV